MTLSKWDTVLWAAGFIGHVALLLVMFARRRFREFPIFTLFLAFETFTTILLFFTYRYGSKHGYFIAYWSTGLLNYIFQVALIFEIARDVLRPTGTWVRDAKRSFLGWGSIGLLLAFILSLQIAPPQSKGFDLWDTRITVFTSLLTCELILAMATAATRLGLQWRSHVVAVGQGLAIWALIALLEEFAHAALGWNQEFVVFTHARMVVYLVVLIYWIVAFWLPERVRAPLSPEMRAYLVALHEQVKYDLTSIDRPSL